MEELDYQELKPRKYTTKKLFLISIIGALFITTIEVFFLNKNFFDLGMNFTFIFYFLFWILTFFTIMDVMQNNKKGNYIKGAWYFGVFFLPLIFAPIYYFFRNSYSPKSLNSKIKKENNNE